MAENLNPCIVYTPEIHYGKFIDFLPLVQKVLKLMDRQELWGNKMSQRHSNDICISGSTMGFRFERKHHQGSMW